MMSMRIHFPLLSIAIFASFIGGPAAVFLLMIVCGNGFEALGYPWSAVVALALMPLLSFELYQFFKRVVFRYLIRAHCGDPACPGQAYPNTMSAPTWDKTGFTRTCTSSATMWYLCARCGKKWDPSLYEWRFQWILVLFGSCFTWVSFKIAMYERSSVTDIDLSPPVLLVFFVLGVAPIVAGTVLWPRFWRPPTSTSPFKPRR